LVRQLVEAGYAVRAVSRSKPITSPFRDKVESWNGDICDCDFMTRSLQGVETVFHLAARLHHPNPGQEQQSDYWRVNVEGTRRLVDASVAAGVRRLIFFSTISVYGAARAVAADESTPPHAETLYAQTKLAAEQVVLAAKRLHTELPLGVVLRMAAIYGPRMKGNYSRLVKALSRGWFVPIGDGSNQRTLVFEEDAVRAAILAAEHPRSAGQIYNVTDGEVHSLREILAAVCAALGTRPPRFHLPLRPARVSAGIADGLARLFGQSLDWTAMVDKLVENVAVKADRITGDLSFRPRYGLEEGWRRAIAAWRIEVS
jgi:UDP-glucose 4-epimerase